MKKFSFDTIKLGKKIIDDDTTIVKLVWIIISTVCALFLLSFLISAIVIKARTEKDYEIREAETILSNTSASIESSIDNYKDLSRLVMLNDEIIKFCRALSVDAGITNDARFGVMEIMNVSDNLDSVIVVRNDYSYMNTGRSTYTFDLQLMRTDSWRNILLDKKGGAVVSMNGSGAVMRQDESPIISIERAIYDINSQKLTGMLLLNFTTGMLDKIILSQGDADVCIMDVDGNFLSGEEELIPYFNEKALSEKAIYKEHGFFLSRNMISTKKVKDTPFVIICKTNGGTGSVPVEILISFGLLLLAFIASMIITTSFIIRNFTNPIISLSEAMEKTKEAGWLKKVDVSMPKNEIGQLADSYNSMIEYLNDLFNRLLENEKEIQKAELRVLQEQIKPHFLYNSLECINCMAMDEGAPEVQKAIETLGNFYRNSLSKGNREIPLNREITIVKDYMYLQRLRYGDSLNDEYDIDEETLGVYVPKLTLQPLVENSIYHGIRLKGEPGVIKVSCHLMDNNLIIEIYDTGVGMSEAKIAEVLSGDAPQSKEDNSLSGFGLKGTVKRLRYYSNREDVVDIKSEPGEFTKITINLPVLKKESE